MKLLQRILSRGLLISIAILAAVAFHFRATLFPQWFGPEAKPRETAQAPVIPAPAADLPDNTEQPMPQESAVTAPAPVSAAAPPASVTAPVAPMENPQPAASAAGAPPTVTGTGAPAAIAPAAGGAPTAAASAPTVSPALDEARHAYWQQDLAAAERLYRESATANPADPDALGELGNLLYEQGRWSDAAEAYAGAVERLLAVGDHGRANYLMNVLDGLDPARARAIRTSMTRGGG